MTAQTNTGRILAAVADTSARRWGSIDDGSTWTWVSEVAVSGGEWGPVIEDVAMGDGAACRW